MGVFDVNCLESSLLNDLVGIEFPICQAPMAGGATTPEMAAAVSNAGGLGCLGVGYLSAEKIREDIQAVRRLTDRPFGVNLFVPDAAAPDPLSARKALDVLAPYHQELGLPAPEIPNRFAESFEAQVEVLLQENIPVFSFTFGIPDPAILTAFKDAGTIVVGTATTVGEGRLLKAAGVHGIVAQGVEAGGHRGTFDGDCEDALLGLVALVPQLVDAVPVPVIASGGIMDARGILAAMALGASGVQMGTAFLSTHESGINATYRREILNVSKDTTQLTRAYSGRWARGIQTRFMAELAAHGRDIPPYPIQNTLTKGLRQAAAKSGRAEFLSLWAGQAASLAKETPAGELVRNLADECTELLRRMGA
jgi:nitronate monooxygenase